MKKRYRGLLVAVGSAVIALGTLAAPVAAATTKLAIVNGHPGQKVDVCVNGQEVRSALPYGGIVFRTTNTRRVTVKFFRRDPRRCAGPLLAQASSGLDDITIVLTKRNPQKVLVWDNLFIASPTAALAPRAEWRHSADVGLVGFGRNNDLDEPGQLNPSLIDNMAKGQKANVFYDLSATQDGFTVTTEIRQSDVPIVTPQPHWIRPLRRFEWILLGSSLDNAKLIFIDRPAAVVAP